MVINVLGFHPWLSKNNDFLHKSPQYPTFVDKFSLSSPTGLSWLQKYAPKHGQYTEKRLPRFA